MMIYIMIFILVFIGMRTFFQVIFNEPLAQIPSAEKGLRQRIKGFKQRFISCLALYVKVNEKRLENLKKRLYKAGLETTPQEFICEGVLRTTPIILLDILLIINNNFFLGIALAMVALFKIALHFDKLNKRIAQIKRKIIEEIPEFTSYLTNSLKMDKDILKLVDNYLKAASPILGNELKLLSADLKTGNIDEALYNFDIRLNIPRLSNYITVVRALLNGESQISNLEIITTDMEIYEYEIAKKYAEELPAKVSKASFVVGVSMILFFIILMLYNFNLIYNNFN